MFAIPIYRLTPTTYKPSIKYFLILKKIIVAPAMHEGLDLKDDLLEKMLFTLEDNGKIYVQKA